MQSKGDRPSQRYVLRPDLKDDVLVILSDADSEFESLWLIKCLAVD